MNGMKTIEQLIPEYENELSIIEKKMRAIDRQNINFEASKRYDCLLGMKSDLLYSLHMMYRYVSQQKHGKDR